MYDIQEREEFNNRLFSQESIYSTNTVQLQGLGKYNTFALCTHMQNSCGINRIFVTEVLRQGS